MAAQATDPLLELRAVSAGYVGNAVLHDVALHVRVGEIVTLLGPNGAGKTTTLNAVFGLTPYARGEVRYRGRPLPPKRVTALVRQGIAYVPEGARVFVSLTVADNLALGGYSCRRRSRAERDGQLEFVYSLFPVLRERARLEAECLSGGERQMLALGRALMSHPQLLLLDEPSLGLAPLLIKELMASIGRMRDQGLSILLVEQNARAALRVADRGYVMEGGMIVTQGSAKELACDSKVLHAYLGESR